MASVLLNSKSKLNAIKRINRDLIENSKNPLEGIQIFIPNDDDIFNLHCEIKILYGIYKDIIIHSVIHLPDSYPVIGPAMNIMDDFRLPSNFHHHILGTSICNDMLTNFKSYFETIDGGKELKVASGWSTGYSLNVILSQMQIFFCDPDMKNHLSKDEIDKLIIDSHKYSCKMCSERKQYSDPNSNKLTLNESLEINELRLNKFKSDLICGLTKNSMLTDEKIILGYPILLRTDRFGRLWPQILIELLSYDGYVMQLQQLGFIKLNNFEKVKAFSPNGELYNFWIPIFLNEVHFQRSFQLTLNSISVIRYGIRGTTNTDFRVDMILQVLPCLINKTIVFILNGTIFHSLAAIQAYCHLLRLYQRLIEQYPDLKNKIEAIIEQFHSSEANRIKKKCPDLGEFIINLFLSSRFTYDQLKHALFHEFVSRQIFWIEKNEMGRIESIDRSKLVEKAFNSSKVSNQLLMFNLIAARWFIECKERQRQMDENFGFMDAESINEFKNVIIRIKSIKTYLEFFNEIKINEYNTEEKLINFLMKCKQTAVLNGYVN